MTTIRAQRCRSTWRRTGVAFALAAGPGLGVPGLGLLLAGSPATAAEVMAPELSVVGLRQGSSGELVRAVQQRLLSYGYVIAGGADGVFGPATTRVLERFQEQNGLNPTGVVTEATARHLGFGNGATPPSSADPNTSSSSGPTPAESAHPGATAWNGLQRGATGDAVRELQQELVDLGLVIGGVDGIFGPATERGVQMVQRVNGLAETGVVDGTVAGLLGLTGDAPAAPATPAPAAAPSPDPTAAAPAASPSSAWQGLAPGATGSGVRELQQELADLGLVIGDVDGVYGDGTTRGVRAVQSVNALAETGVVDSRVAEILGLDGSPAPTTRPSSPGANGETTSSAAIAIAAARSQIGVPYSFARAAPGIAFDCSGLTRWAWGKAGVQLPHYSAMQYAVTTRISVANARPGDLLFFHAPVSHVAMYLGKGLMIDAAEPGTTVSVRAVRWSSVVGVGRPG